MARLRVSDFRLRCDRFDVYSCYGIDIRRATEVRGRGNKNNNKIAICMNGFVCEILVLLAKYLRVLIQANHDNNKQ